MAKHQMIRRYFLELEKIKQGRFPSKENLLDYLDEHGLETSKRTLERDLKQLQEEFGVDLKHNKAKGGYQILNEDDPEVDSFFRFLEMVNTAELLTESLLESKGSLSHISFDNSGNLKGIEHLKPLLDAVKNRREISFSHFNFHSGKSKIFNLQPYLLKEYQSRWYVVGLVEGYSELRTFGIDRIENLTVSTETFKQNQDLNPWGKFSQTIGLVYSINKPQKVVLSFTPTQGQYIKTLPLHASQEVLIDDDKEFRIALYIIPNYELNQQILKHGATVRVLEPQWLKEEIADILRQALEQY